jgi:hypothetical protein
MEIKCFLFIFWNDEQNVIIETCLYQYMQIILNDYQIYSQYTW